MAGNSDLLCFHGLSPRHLGNNDHHFRGSSPCLLSDKVFSTSEGHVPVSSATRSSPVMADDSDLLRFHEPSPPLLGNNNLLHFRGPSPYLLGDEVFPSAISGIVKVGRALISSVVALRWLAARVRAKQQ